MTSFDDDGLPEPKDPWVQMDGSGPRRQEQVFSRQCKKKKTYITRSASTHYMEDAGGVRLNGIVSDGVPNNRVCEPKLVRARSPVPVDFP